MKNNNKIIGLLSCWLVLSCVDDRNFDSPKRLCDTSVITNSTYTEIKGLYMNETLQIQEDLAIEGYVVSSDEAGNFFSILHFQDRPIAPTEGFQIEIDVRDAHLFYPIGSKIIIKLKGLYLGKSKDVYKIGGVFTSFGNISVGRLPAAIVDNHIFTSCDQAVDIAPTQVSIDSLNKNQTNTLVRFERVEFLEQELGQTFALDGKETERTLIDCYDNEIVLLNSGFADFSAEILPNGSGGVTGVLLRQNDEYQLAVRDLNDFDFSQERCEDVVDEFTSTAIFISELADPDNNSSARFVELYNSNSESLSLKGWTLRRYTNASTEISSTLDLSDNVIEAESTFVISPNASEFEIVYGFAPNLGIGTGSPADSNGDDNFELVDPFGVVIDVFGVIGEDGSGTDHEFEDGRALRNIEITKANAIYSSDEWVIYNDTGDSGTMNQPQNAPNDFTPGVRN
ncbi:DUF5689 domain-containing protein [Kriegella aquimaris]|uniref:Lamin Tail Domain n=1 Tax=Kriegella aquimaris TaxID=192904 RepID=A0A1G9LYM4_9FLAO|nr:DUF5689 domain-containing protein [Kriegella aquimaris]SDL66495.1 Lamin Tail Domain [Kriegella aquimaris]